MTQTEYEQLHRWSLEQELQDPALGPGLAAMRNKISKLVVKDGYVSPYHNQRPNVGGYLGSLADSPLRNLAGSASFNPQRMT